MNNNDDFTPEEGAEQNQPLIQKLRRVYQTNDADAQSLARMRVRLLAGNELNDAMTKHVSEQGRWNRMHLNNTGTDAKSHSEGVTWQRRLSLIAAAVFVVLLVGSLIVVLSHARQSATGNNKVAGTTWQRQSQLIGIHMFDATTGWAECSGGTILRTTDGGIHWKDVTPQQIPHTTLWSGRNQYINTTTAWIAVTVNKDNSLYYRPSVTSMVFHTTDGGQTWQQATLNTGGNLVKEITFATPQDGWLLTTLEQGIHEVTGPQQNPPPDLFRTTDGGKTWVRVLSSTSSQAKIFSNVSITGISFGDQTTGLLTGMTGGSIPHLYRTHDGGKTWQLQILPAIQNVSSQVPSGGGGPTFFTSTEALVPVFFNQNSDLAIYTTHDGGATWRGSPLLHIVSNFAQTSPTQGPYVLKEPPLFINMHDGWEESFDGQHGVLYATSDGGQHWTKVTPKPGTVMVNSLPNFATSTIGWAFDYAFNTRTGGQTTVLYETTDGGQSWKQVHAIFPGFMIPKSAFSN